LNDGKAAGVVVVYGGSTEYFGKKHVKSSRVAKPGKHVKSSRVPVCYQHKEKSLFTTAYTHTEPAHSSPAKERHMKIITYE
jgi:hypothetical protein